MQIKEICEINPKGLTLSDDTEVSFVPMPAVSEGGTIDTSETRRFEEVKHDSTAFAENDVLFAKITPSMENGKGCVARDLVNGVGCGSTEFHVLRADERLVRPEWLY